MTALTIKANGIRLAYDEFGDKSDSAILLVMGLGAQMIAWPEDFCQLLAAEGYRVIRFDNRDIGLSHKFDGLAPPHIVKSMLFSRLGFSLNTPYTLADMVDDSVGVLDSLNIDKAHIVGASMGGMICQLMAANYPNRVLSLTSIMSTSGHRSLPGPGLKVLKLMATRSNSDPENHDTEAYIVDSMAFWRVIGSPGYMPSDEQLRDKISRSYHRSYYPAGYGRQLAAISASGDRVSQLQTIKMPTLVIHGNADVLVPVKSGIHTASLIKGARLEIFEGMGHDFPQPLFNDFAQLIHENASQVAE